MSFDPRLRGRARRLGAGITTDDILPGAYLDRSNEEAAQFALAGLGPDFVREFTRGDFIVAGPHFGAGSGREGAPAALIGAGVAAILAPSFGRLFYRNLINMGVPAIILDTEQILPGEQLELDLEAHSVTRLATGEQLPITNLTGTAMDILRAGGIFPFTLARLGRTAAPPKPSS